jgi:hypothetical protein
MDKILHEESQTVMSPGRILPEFLTEGFPSFSEFLQENCGISP